MVTLQGRGCTLSGYMPGYAWAAELLEGKVRGQVVVDVNR